MMHRPKRQRLPLTTIIIYMLYQIIFPIFLLFGFSLAAWHSWTNPSLLKRLPDRFGFGPVGPKNSIWFYAASLGEMNAARPLVQIFINNGHDVLLTHLSPAGFEAGKLFFGDHPRVTHRYIPLDFYFFMQIFLYRSRPSCGIVLEIEIWPAMLIVADTLGVPMYLANGNLLAKKMSRLKNWKRSNLHMYRLFDHIFTRTEDYADRYEETGVLRNDITVTGELRLDMPRDPLLIARGEFLRTAWAGKNFTFMISSSVQIEEDPLLRCCVELLKKIPKTRVIWVPRSPQRFNAVNNKAQKTGLICMKRSDLQDGIPTATQLFLGDSIGEMDLYLGMADIVFVGASFNGNGGHNIVEPLSAGCPVVMGPSTYSVDFIAKDAAAAGIFHSFSTPKEMIDFIIDIAKSPEKLGELKSASSTFCDMNVGASRRCYEMIKSFT
jgi:3-deoxy-D-manno-octulosonic-acid transferase